MGRGQFAVAPACCAVVEDAEAGIDAALAAGMWAIGLGRRTARRSRPHALRQLAGSGWPTVRAGSWRLPRGRWRKAAFDPAAKAIRRRIFTIGNGAFCLRGTLEEGYPGDMPACFVHRVWDDMPIISPSWPTSRAGLAWMCGLTGSGFGRTGATVSYRR